jgi:hypothetical protein
VSFLAPVAAIVAAAVALPTLLLLYFLKLRRRPVRVGSTLLWLKSIEDLQVNAPFQRLRLSLLLLVQAMILACVVIAIGRPAIEGAGPGGDRLIILIDHSASMNARDDGPDSPTRLDRAKARARELVNQAAASSGRAVMIVAFARAPEVLLPFEESRRAALDAIDSIQPTDEEADLAAALELTDAFATGGGEEADAPPALAIVTDGGVRPPESRGGFIARASAASVIDVGPARDALVDNLGVATIAARRSPIDPARADLFARFVNAGSNTIDAPVAILVNGAAEQVARVPIPPAGPDGPGFVERSFDVAAPDESIITIHVRRPDALAADDVASLILPPPRSPRLAIVTAEPPGDAFLRAALAAAGGGEPRVMAGEDFWSLAASSPGGAPPFDLIAFDRIAPPRLPPIASITFGATMPGLSTLSTAAPTTGRTFASWRRDDPLLRHVDLDGVIFSDFSGFEIDAELTDRARAIALGPDGPVIVARDDRAVPHIAVGFQLVNSNWPTTVGFLVFLRNVIDRSMGDSDAGAASRAGDPVIVAPLAGASAITITRGEERIELPIDGRAAVTLPALRTAGVREVAGAVPRHVAVNVESEVESDLRPRSDAIEVTARAAGAAGAEQGGSREVWPWFVVAAIALLTLEWLLYLRRAGS